MSQDVVIFIESSCNHQTNRDRITAAGVFLAIDRFAVQAVQNDLGFGDLLGHGFPVMQRLSTWLKENPAVKAIIDSNTLLAIPLHAAIIAAEQEQMP